MLDYYLGNIEWASNDSPLAFILLLLVLRASMGGQVAPVDGIDGKRVVVLCCDSIS